MPHTTSTAFDYAIVTVQRSRKPIRTKKLVRNRKSRKKRQIPKQHIQLSFWASIARPSFKIHQFHSHHNLAPRPFVDGIMDRHDRLHVDCSDYGSCAPWRQRTVLRRGTPSFRRSPWVLRIFRGPVKGRRGGSEMRPLMTGDGPSRIDYRGQLMRFWQSCGLLGMIHAVRCGRLDKSRSSTMKSMMKPYVKRHFA
jgi:hypothetical protein